jgi:hypothetical protein
MKREKRHGDKVHLLYELGYIIPCVENILKVVYPLDRRLGG